MKKIKNLKVGERIATSTSIQEITDIKTAGKYVIFRTKRIFPAPNDGEMYCIHTRNGEREINNVNHRNAEKIRDILIQQYKITG